MSKKSLGARLWFDDSRQNWVIRDGRRFIRTGAAGWRAAQDALTTYLDGMDPLDRAMVRNRVKTALGRVYFITADAPDYPVKIGFTQKPEGMRSKGLQIGCPYPIQLIGSISGTFKDEGRLHRQFAAYRLQGEWFKRTPELLAGIQEMLCQARPSLPDERGTLKSLSFCGKPFESIGFDGNKEIGSLVNREVRS